MYITFNILIGGNALSVPYILRCDALNTKVYGQNDIPYQGKDKIYTMWRKIIGEVEWTFRPNVSVWDWRRRHISLDYGQGSEHFIYAECSETLLLKTMTKRAFSRAETWYGFRQNDGKYQLGCELVKRPGSLAKCTTKNGQYYCSSSICHVCTQHTRDTRVFWHFCFVSAAASILIGKYILMLLIIERTASYNL